MTLSITWSRVILSPAQVLNGKNTNNNRTATLGAIFISAIFSEHDAGLMASSPKRLLTKAALSPMHPSTKHGLQQKEHSIEIYLRGALEWMKTVPNVSPISTSKQQPTSLTVTTQPDYPGMT
ncbi:MAG: hypothetical protein RBT11_11750 [Desulfobacterales bacterium]|jgi:hypothetical protein|nr:hypothetical protein [Desulfobacterales bacterium]